MKHRIANDATGANKASEVLSPQANAAKKRAKVQSKALNDSLPETRMASTISPERKVKSWKRFSKKYVGKKLFVQDN